MPERVDTGLAAAGFAQPFKIQGAAIPVALAGRDVCGRARTGSGKTLAFGVPMLCRIVDRAAPSRPLGLVLVPTRELAVQVSEVLEPVANHGGQRILAVYGGSSRQHQVERLGEGVEIVVATPLRLIDLLKAGDISLADVDVVVLDEADRMADDGFTPQVEWVLRHCTGRTQTMLFSATLDGDVGHIIRRYLTDPVEVAIDLATDTVGTMHHLFLAVHHMDKDRVVGAIGQSTPKLLVFCQTKRSCDRVAHSLADLGIAAEAIHGDLPQPVRERVLHKFADGSLPVLVATDVAARGIDIDDIGAVIHYEPAKDSKDYLHRSGRTARAGRDGWAITLRRVQPAHPDAHAPAPSPVAAHAGDRGVQQRRATAPPRRLPRRCRRQRDRGRSGLRRPPPRFTSWGSFASDAGTDSPQKADWHGSLVLLGFVWVGRALRHGCMALKSGRTAASRRVLGF